MANDITTLTSLTDAQLLARVKLLAVEERQSTADLIAGLTELDLRRLYLGEGCSSLFAYCTQVLHLSEDAAYNRIRAARVAARWPEVLELIATGSLTVTAVRLLSDVLTDTNHAELFATARQKSKRELESIVAAAKPRPDVPSSVRRASTPTTQARVSAEPSARVIDLADPGVNTEPVEERQPIPPQAKPSRLAPLSSEQYRVQFTISKATHDKLRRVQDLMRHTDPKGDPAAIFERALTVLLEQLEKAKFGKATRPRNNEGSTHRSRHIPAAVKREVEARDGRRCAFVGAAGRCRETGFLEYHHVVPYADGGASTVGNIQLRCRAHNAYEAETWFGLSVVRELRELYAFG
jgi:hypothetical protein